MRPVNGFKVLVLIALVTVRAWSDDERRAKANALLVQAEKASVFLPDAEKAPFHEKVSFTFAGLVGKDQNGTYVRDYLSKEQWRWKWDFPEYQEINVRNGKQIGERATTEFGPLRIRQLRWALPPFYLILGTNDLVSKIESEKVNGIAAQCIQYDALREGKRTSREICLSVENFTPLRWVDDWLEVEWSNYTPFQGRFYPRHLVVKKRNSKIIEADIEFQDAPGLSPNLFQIPPDLSLKPACEHLTAPVVIKKENPEYPQRLGTRTVDADVEVEVKVGEKGNVEATQITETSGDLFDSAALVAAKKWEFEPAKCDGQPISHNMSVTIHFKKR